MSGLGGWDVWQASDGSGACAAVNASDLGLTQGSIADAFVAIDRSHPGYDPVCGCYCWGYKPKPVQIIGLGALGPGWKVCNSSGYSSGRRCPCENSPDCPPQRACPTCPPPPPCPTAIAPPPSEGAAQSGPEVFGVNIGLVVAATLTAGVGYYGYRKGWFKKKRR